MKKKHTQVRLIYWIIIVIGSGALGIYMTKTQWNTAVLALWLVVIFLGAMAVEMLWFRSLGKKVAALTPLLRTDPDRYIAGIEDLLGDVRSLGVQQTRCINLAAACCEKGDYAKAVDYLTSLDPRRIPAVNQGAYWADLALARFHLGQNEQARAVIDGSADLFTLRFRAGKAGAPSPRGTWSWPGSGTTPPGRPGPIPPPRRSWTSLRPSSGDNEKGRNAMLLHVLAVGDVCSDVGLDCLHRHLRQVKKLYEIDFTVVNGENAAGLGLLPRHADELFDAGADVITLGNHTWDKRQIADYLDRSPYILRPANFSPRTPGRGFGIYEGPRGLRIGVLSLMGRFELNSNLSSPFDMADKVLAGEGKEADVVLVDFHAEATRGEGAMGWYLDGRVSAVWGTHTHVPTADQQILPKGTGFVTDLGMTGPIHSILGVKPEVSINRFLGGMPMRYEPGPAPGKLNAVRFVIDTDTRQCVEVARCDLLD